jgi:hypothetical protein
MPALTTRDKRKTKPARPVVANPEGIIRHNINVWRGMGYSDDYIGRCMMSPSLRSRSEFEYWGLCAGEKPPLSEEAALVVPVIQQMLAEAKEEGRTLTLHQFEVRFGKSRFTRLRHDNQAIREVVEEVFTYNKSRGGHTRINGEWLAEKLAKAESIVAKAEADGVTVTAAEVSAQVGKGRAWLSNCKSPRHARSPEVKLRAEALIDRIKALRKAS